MPSPLFKPFKVHSKCTDWRPEPEPSHFVWDTEICQNRCQDVMPRTLSLVRHPTHWTIMPLHCCLSPRDFSIDAAGSVPENIIILRFFQISINVTTLFNWHIELSLTWKSLVLTLSRWVNNFADWSEQYKKIKFGSQLPERDRSFSEPERSCLFVRCWDFARSRKIL